MEIAKLQDKKRLLCYFNDLQRFYDELTYHTKFLGYNLEGEYYYVKDIIEDLNKDIPLPELDFHVQRVIDIMEYYSEKIENIARKYRIVREETKPTGCD